MLEVRISKHANVTKSNFTKFIINVDTYEYIPKNSTVGKTSFILQNELFHFLFYRESQQAWDDGLFTLYMRH